ncbi:MAG: aldehyde dehydrogenase family protein [Bacteroidia bacterium]
MRVFQEENLRPGGLCDDVQGRSRSHQKSPTIRCTALGAGVWTRDMHQAYQISRNIEAGRVWVNCYHAYPAHAPFGGYRSLESVVKFQVMLNHYRQTKNMLIPTIKMPWDFSKK